MLLLLPRQQNIDVDGPWHFGSGHQGADENPRDSSVDWLLEYRVNIAILIRLHNKPTAPGIESRGLGRSIWFSSIDCRLSRRDMIPSTAAFGAHDLLLSGLGYRYTSNVKLKATAPALSHAVRARQDRVKPSRLKDTGELVYWLFSINSLCDSYMLLCTVTMIPYA